MVWLTSCTCTCTYTYLFTASSFSSVTHPIPFLLPISPLHLLYRPSHPSTLSPPLSQSRYNILQHTLPELQQLHSCLEVEFNPLLLCKKILPILDKLEEDDTLKQYVEPMKEVSLVRLIKEVWSVDMCIV